MQVGQIVNITNKTPMVRMDGAEVVTGKTGKKRERQVLGEEGRLRQQISLADLQEYVEIDQKDREESPTFEPIQEPSPREMPPSAQGLLTPSDGDPNLPAVRGSLDENCHNLQDFVEIDQTDRDESPTFEPIQESPPLRCPPQPSDGEPNPPTVRGSLDENCHKHLW